jgi:hypothetical protein
MLEPSTNALAKPAFGLLWLPLVLALQLPASAAPLDNAVVRKPPAQSKVVIAQDAGSAGGTVGKPDKSATGNNGDDSAKPQQRSRSAPPKSRKSDDDDTPSKRNAKVSPSTDTSGPIPADGSWTGVSAGPCIITWHWSLNVNNGVVTGTSNATGHVTRSGGITGNMTVLGQRYDFVGRMVGTTGSGSWTNLGPRGCSGNWTASKS